MFLHIPSKVDQHIHSKVDQKNSIVYDKYLDLSKIITSKNYIFWLDQH